MSTLDRSGDDARPPCNAGSPTRSSPRPEAEGELPRILTTLIERLDAYLTDPVSALPSLNSANDSIRQQRIERRLACVRLLSVHIQYMDLASMRVGVPQRNGGFLSFTLGFLARQAGLGLRRAERAMKDLLCAGLVRSQRRCQRGEDGEYRGLAALRQLPPALFAAFGLGKWLGHERSKAVMRRNRALAAAAKPVAGCACRPKGP